MRKFAKIIAGLATGTALAAGAYQLRMDRTQQEIAQKILRFHVIANSDSQKDQALKLMVRDRVGAYLAKEIEDAGSLEECMAIAERDKRQIEQCAKQAIAEEGCDYSVEAVVAEVDFPTKTYGIYTFPAGSYHTLEVVIGEGAGQNWWCVMYPNLCFANSLYEAAAEDSQKKLEAVLTAEECAEVMAEGKIQVKLRYLEKLREAFD